MADIETRFVSPWAILHTEDSLQQFIVEAETMNRLSLNDLSSMERRLIVAALATLTLYHNIAKSKPRSVLLFTGVYF